MKSPSFDYLERVFVPVFNNFMGNNVQAVLKRPGYFPRGGGVVELMVSPTNEGKFLPFNLTERGRITNIEAILNVTPRMCSQVSQFKERIADITTDIEVREVSYASVEIFLHCEKSRAGFSHLVEGRNPRPDQLLEGIDLVKMEVNDFRTSSAAIDGYLQDQVIIYMTLAKISNPLSQSRVTTITPSDHTTSAIHVAQLFTPENKFQIIQRDDGSQEIVL